ncbi:hypothetical protein [Streptomyces sp. CB03238]|uniref:hypothetical protein n=1 Tax=Streptomyces sp. CB03238 TaxID=1907777 RepID=UPI000A1046DA|nr:hypothetical protein [Streptomyces sp. CB03238]ORT56856.1 hypothetical protein BKD26_27260 [Streptomyces sp. CB03238]
MDDCELTKGIDTCAPPDQFVRLRLAAYDAAADAGISWALKGQPPRRAEVRIASELHQDIQAARAAWGAPETTDDHWPQLVRRLHSLLHISHLIPALLDTSGGQDLDADLVQALRTAAVMCGGFDRPLTELEESLRDSSAHRHGRASDPDLLAAASRHALTALLLLDKQLLSKIAARGNTP